MIGHTLLEASAFSGRSEKGDLGQTKVRRFDSSDREAETLKAWQTRRN